MMRVRPEHVVLVLLCLGCRVNVVRSANRQSDRCTANVRSMSRITLPGDTTVSLDATAMAPSGAELAVAGNYVHLFPRVGMRPRAGLGVIRDRHGVFRVLPHIPGAPTATEPRIVDAAAGGWHVLALVGEDIGEGDLIAHRGTLWYGRYDGRAWHDVRQVAAVGHARVRRGYGSQLVRTDDGVAFAFPFGYWTRGPSASQGLVMLRMRQGQWQIDTLRTELDGPSGVDLAAGPAGVVTAVFARSGLRRDDVHSRLFLATHDSAWEAPRLLLDAGPARVDEPQLAAGAAFRKEPIPLTWRASPPDASVDSTYAGLFTLAEGTVASRTAIAPSTRAPRAAVVLDRLGRAFVLSSRLQGDHLVHIAIMDARGVRSAGPLRVPFENSFIRAVSLADGTVAMITTARDTASGAPPAYTVLTEFRVDCPPH